MSTPTMQTIRDAVATALGNLPGTWVEASHHFDVFEFQTDNLMPRSWAIGLPDTRITDSRRAVKTRLTTEDGIYSDTTTRVKWAHRLRADGQTLDHQDALTDEVAVLQAIAKIDLNGIGTFSLSSISRNVAGDGTWHITEAEFRCRHLYGAIDPDTSYSGSSGDSGVYAVTLGDGVVVEDSQAEVNFATGGAAYVDGSNEVRARLGDATEVVADAVVPVVGAGAEIVGSQVVASDLPYHTYDMSTEILGSKAGTAGYTVTWAHAAGVSTASYTGSGGVADSHWEMYAATLPVYDPAGNQVDLSTREYTIHIQLDMDPDSLRYSDAPMIRIGVGELSGGLETNANFTGFTQAISVGVIEGATTGDNRTSGDAGGPSDSTTSAPGVSRMYACYTPDWEEGTPETLPVGSMVATYRDDSDGYVAKRAEASVVDAPGTGEIGLVVLLGQHAAGSSAMELDFSLRAVAVKTH